MLILPPPKFRGRRLTPQVASTVPAVPPLVLVDVHFDPTGVTLDLFFDQAISLAAFDGTQISVNDPLDSDALLLATGAAFVFSHSALRVALVASGPAVGDEVLLNATALTGILGAGNGAVWAGVKDMPVE